ncbi:MAG: choice-of-anchor J domain-containing protein [Deltaproteobacteria bacterium]|nr:choice-of-anchor J domain-containing protein [Deltaproteobacteria bacterium]
MRTTRATSCRAAALAVLSAMFLVSVAVPAPADVLFQEGFEAGLGNWIVDNGVWEVGTPASGPNGAHSGTGVLATILSGNYTDDRTSRVVGPAFVVPAADQNPWLRFWHWWSIAGHDFGKVQVSTDNGATWADLSAQYTADSSGQWARATLDLSAYAGQSVRIGFYFEPHHYSSYGVYYTDVGSGWYIDQVEVVIGPLPVWAGGGGGSVDGDERHLGDRGADPATSPPWPMSVPRKQP